MPTIDYAETSWAVEDILYAAKNMDVHISKKEARQLLNDKGDQIIDAMVDAGWAVIEELLSQRRDRGKV